MADTIRQNEINAILWRACDIFRGTGHGAGAPAVALSCKGDNRLPALSGYGSAVAPGRGYRRRDEGSGC